MSSSDYGAVTDNTPTTEWLITPCKSYPNLPWVLISLCLYPSYYPAHSVSHPTLTLTRGSVCYWYCGLTRGGGGGGWLLTVHLALESFPLFFLVADKENGKIPHAIVVTIV